MKAKHCTLIISILIFLSSLGLDHANACRLFQNSSMVDQLISDFFANDDKENASFEQFKAALEAKRIEWNIIVMGAGSPLKLESHLQTFLFGRDEFKVPADRIPEKYLRAIARASRARTNHEMLNDAFYELTLWAFPQLHSAKRDLIVRFQELYLSYEKATEQLSEGIKSGDQNRIELALTQFEALLSKTRKCGYVMKTSVQLQIGTELAKILNASENISPAHLRHKLRFTILQYLSENELSLHGDIVSELNSLRNLRSTKEDPHHLGDKADMTLLDLLQLILDF